MSHVAKFNLSLEDENRLRTALSALGCPITEGHFTDYYGHQQSKYDGKQVVFGFSIKRQVAGQPNGQAYNRFCFTRDADGSLLLCGDDYGMGIGRAKIREAIANSYANEGVNESVPVLEALGYVEQTTENTVQLQMLA